MSTFKRMMEAMLEAQRQWQDQNEQMKKIMLEHGHHLRDAMKATSLATQYILQQRDQLLASQREAQKWMQSFQEQIGQLRVKEVFAAAIESQKMIAEQIKQTALSQHFTWVSEVQKQWAASADIYLSRFDPDTIKVTPSGDIVLGRETVNTEDLTASIELLIEELAEVSTPVEYFQRVFSFLGRLKTRLAQAVFCLILPYMLAILANLTTPIFETWWKELTGQTKEEVTTRIRENALDRYDPSQLEDHRFVTAERLRVRAGPSKEQKVRDTLPRGKVVRVIRAKYHWAQVEYFDEEQQKIRKGWVSTSRLGKLTK